LTKATIIDPARMGASFVVENEPELAVFSSLSYWPSSTRAELAAIFIALLTAPSHACITIHTDSLCAIQVLNKDNHTHTRHWLKTTNVSWISKITTVIKEKSLNVSYVKVKGHSDNLYNDLADALAKEGGEQKDLSIDNNSVYNNNHLTFFPFYFHIPIEQKLRKFMGSLFQAHICSEWTLLKSINKDIISNDIDWKATWTLLKNLTGF